MTGSFISQDRCSSRATTIPMWSHVQPDHCVQRHVPGGTASLPSSEIFRIRTMNRPLLPFTPDLAPHQPQLGEGSPQPVHCPQRGDQYHPGKCGQNAGQGRDYGVAALKGTAPQGASVVDRKGSDSAMLDNTLEFLVMSGMELPLAVMITIPEPWSNNQTLSQEIGIFISITPP